MASYRRRDRLELPRGLKPDEDWFERAQKNLMQNPDLMSHGFKDRLEEAAYQAGYAYGQTRKPFFLTEMKILLALGKKHGLDRMAQKSFKEGEEDGKSSSSRSAFLRAELIRLAHDNPDHRSLLVPLIRRSRRAG